MNKEKLDKLLIIRKENLVNRLVAEYRANTLTIEKANGIGGALSEIHYWLKKDYEEILEEEEKILGTTRT